jgi:hypothetical protein
LIFCGATDALPIAFEDLGFQLFEKIDGDYLSILGLPLLPLGERGVKGANLGGYAMSATTHTGKATSRMQKNAPAPTSSWTRERRWQTCKLKSIHSSRLHGSSMARITLLSSIDYRN